MPASVVILCGVENLLAHIIFSLIGHLGFTAAGKLEVYLT